MHDYFSKHYITVRSDGAITDAWSDGPHPEKDTANAVCIGQGGYQLHLTINSNETEENPPLFDMDGVPLYKYVDGDVIARTEYEIEDERLSIPPAPPSPMEQLRADIDFIAIMKDVEL